MAAPHGIKLVTLGWQTWAILAIVLTVAVLVGMLVVW